MKVNLWKCFVAVGMAAAFAGLSGCSALPCAARNQPVAAVVRGTCPIVSQQGDMATYTTYLPTGVAASSVLELARTAPVEVAAGAPFEYTLRVTNLTDCPLDDVVVTDRLATANFDLKGSRPQAKLLPDGRAQWDLGTLEGKGAKTVTVQGVPNATGDVVHCYNVDYVRNLCQTVHVIQPKQ